MSVEGRRQVANGSAVLCLIALFLIEAKPIPAAHPASILWTAPAILLASMMIAWGAEAAQFFMAQGFALAILAWLQTLPEFAVEAVLAWHQQTSYLLANLTGALRLLTGLGWPMIYCTAAVAYRIRDKKPLRRITLEPAHGFQVIGLLACLAYVAVIWWKGSLNLLDAGVLIAIYAVYLLVLRRAPAAGHEDIEDLDLIPRSVVTARKPIRVASIAGLFIGGGALIYFLAEPFLASLFALSSVAGVSSFVFIQWVAPFVSEFPEKVSAFYWARTIDKASMALMNMVSSNINQWTLLAAMLPIVYSLSRQAPSAIVFDPTQNVEFLMTIGQSLLGAMFLMNMELAWWEAAGLFALWLIQFIFSIGSAGIRLHWVITIAYFVWAGVEIVRIVFWSRHTTALRHFANMWKRSL